MAIWLSSKFALISPKNDRRISPWLSCIKWINILKCHLFCSYKHHLILCPGNLCASKWCLINIQLLPRKNSWFIHNFECNLCLIFKENPFRAMTNTAPCLACLGGHPSQARNFWGWKINPKRELSGIKWSHLDVCSKWPHLILFQRKRNSRARRMKRASEAGNSLKREVDIERNGEGWDIRRCSLMQKYAKARGMLVDWLVAINYQCHIRNGLLCRLWS